MGVTKRGPIPLRNELIFRTAGFPGFFVPRLLAAEGEGPGRGCGQHLVTIFHESFHNFFYLEGMLELFHFKRFKVSLLSVLGLAYTGFNELNFNLSLGDN